MKFLALSLPLLAAAIWGVPASAQSRGVAMPTAGGHRGDGAQVRQEGHVTRVELRADSLLLTAIDAPDGRRWTAVGIAGATPSDEPGHPALPVYRKLLRMPLGARAAVKAKVGAEARIDLAAQGFAAPVAPARGPGAAGCDDCQPPYSPLAEAYAAQGYPAEPVAQLDILGQLRGVQVARLTVRPVAYDPARGTLLARNEIEVEVTVDAGADHRVPARLASPYFDELYRVFDNHSDALHGRSSGDDYPNQPDLLKAPVGMLIVAHPMFEQELQPYIEWKTQKGFNVQVAYVGNQVQATPTSIKNWVIDKYNQGTPQSPAPSFLVIVGDVAQVPPHQMWEEENSYQAGNYYPSDLGYVMTGNIQQAANTTGTADNFPVMYHGRISVESPEQLAAVVAKVLHYEKYLFDDPGYLDKATLIAGSSGDASPHSYYVEPPIRYLVANHMNAANGYTVVNEYGVQDPNNPASTDGYPADCYSGDKLGVGFVTYKGHCNQSQWAEPNLTDATIAAAGNQGRYPFVVANCCLAGDFAYQYPCIGEQWLRQPDGGAVTYIGSAPTASFPVDYYWAAGHTTSFAAPTLANTTLGAYDAPFIGDYVCAGAIMYAGNLAVTRGRTYARAYWTGYNILGDPSLVPFFGQGAPMGASHAAQIPSGAAAYTVSGLPQGAIAALSRQGALLATQQADASGAATLAFAPQPDGLLDLVITCPKRQPVIATVTVGGGSADIHTVTATAQPADGGTAHGGGSYPQGAAVTVAATANPGFAFDHWSADGAAVSAQAAYTFAMPAHDMALVAHFQPQATPCEPPSDLQATAQGNTATLTWQSAPTATAYNLYRNNTLAASGLQATTYTDANLANGTHIYYVASACGDSQSAPSNTASVTVDLPQLHTIEATAQPADGGAVTGAGGYAHGQSVTLAAVANTGYNFAGWTEGGAPVSAEAAYTFAATADRSLVAHFQPRAYSIVATAGPGGSIDPSGLTAVPHGASATFAIAAGPGHELDAVTVDGNDATAQAAGGSYTFHAVDADHSIAATFRPAAVSTHGAQAGRTAIYPNPFAGTVTIESPAGDPVVEVEVVDARGQVALRADMRGRQTLDVGALPPGAYLFVARTANGQSVHKLHKE